MVGTLAFIVVGTSCLFLVGTRCIMRVTPLNDHDIFNNILEIRPTNSNYQDLQEYFAEHL